jgi:hypothetical protein
MEAGRVRGSEYVFELEEFNLTQLELLEMSRPSTRENANFTKSSAERQKMFFSYVCN